jgi:hypothetical protein
MDHALWNEWTALQKEHDHAHHRYLHVHTLLMDRVSGRAFDNVLAEVLEAHIAATDRWDRAKRKLHDFLLKNSGI